MSNRWSALRQRLLDSKNFGLIIGFLVFLFLSWVAFGSNFAVFTNWDRALGDIYFQYRTLAPVEIVKEGATLNDANSGVSSDIMILGVDNRSIETLGRWPFSRSLHADVLNTLSRIQDQSQRESSVFFDFFFLDRERVPENDLAFVQAIRDSGRVFLETIYAPEALDSDLADVQFARLDTLLGKSGTFGSVTGPWQAMDAYLTVQAPLIPLGEQARGHGFATFGADNDSVLRRQNLISKISKVLGEYDSADLQPDESDYGAQFQRYVYINREGAKVTLPSPLTAEVIAALPELLAADGLIRQVLVEGSETPKDIYVIQKVQDIFLPSITLSLALQYWNKTLADVQVTLGRDLVIPNPQVYDTETGSWKQAPFSEVRIPIDGQGAMTINFMGPRSSESGGYQTFGLRSYAGYATKAPSRDPATWRESQELANKILMIGPFSSGVADDEKSTPFGQMYGVEIHANALNTILMRKFITPVDSWIAIGILLLATLAVSFLASRMSTLVSLLVTVVLVAGGFLGVLYLFEWTDKVYPFSSLLAALLLTFVLVTVYRALTEEREKRKVRNVFSKYVSPDVVTELLLHPPELGGVDKELTVLFSDIRGFTSLSEGMTPQELVNHLNLYLAAMTDLIHEYKGTLDKYVGDEIMCFWGAPLEQADHAELASKCALRMMEKLHEMNEGWPENRKLDIGIGLNSGVMTVGNMGSQGRMNYTLMGDNVNLGARLEGTNKEYLTNIIISESTYQQIQDKAIVRELDNIRVKGKNKPVLIYELVDFDGGFAAPAHTRKK